MNSCLDDLRSKTLWNLQYDQNVSPQSTLPENVIKNPFIPFWALLLPTTNAQKLLSQSHPLAEEMRNVIRVWHYHKLLCLQPKLSHGSITLILLLRWFLWRPNVYCWTDCDVKQSVFLKQLQLIQQDMGIFYLFLTLWNFQIKQPCLLLFANPLMP